MSNIIFTPITINQDILWLKNKSLQKNSTKQKMSTGCKTILSKKWVGVVEQFNNKFFKSDVTPLQSQQVTSAKEMVC